MTEACDLTSKTCTPCQGGVPPMSAAEAERHMAQTPDWTLKDDGRRIERTWRFKDFAGAFELVRKASDLAEAEGHHPDISFGWGYATVSLYTHKIDGLHENDFILAAKLDAAA
jgi:4a-hydroxytetrahydrobiopterin dehydratase